MIEREAQDELRSNMKNRTPLSNKVRSSRWQNQQGITLVTTLLLLTLLMGMSLTMVLAVSSESLINGYYGRYRGSFYAADSGVAASRQQIMNNLQSAIPAGWNPAAGPIANTTTAGTAAQTAITAAFGANFVPVNTANSWQERFKVTNVLVPTPNTVITCVPIGGTTNNCAAPGATVAAPVTGYKYSFPYTVTVIGQSQGSEVATLVDSGTIFLNASATAASYNQSFAAWGMFIGTYAL